MKLASRFLALTLAIALAASQAHSQPHPSPEVRWVASWAVAPQDFLQMPVAPGAAPVVPEVFDHQTLRQRMQATLGGHRVRVRFSNVFGKAPLHIAAASIARSTGVDAISPATLQRLTFGGRGDLTLAPGAQAWSDAARVDIDAGQAVAVSFYVDGAMPSATVHHLPQETTSAVAGNEVMQARWHNARPSTWNHVVTGLDVASAAAQRVVVTFGDSITAGTGGDDSGAQSARYPDRLATRLRELPGYAGSVSVINAGIAGNRLLADHIGPKGVDRFSRDVLEQSGVTHTVILIGINDIGFSRPEGAMPSSESPTAEQLTRGLERLMAQARERGVKVLLGTLTPFKGAPYWSEDKEATRQAVNRWIRGRQDADAVVDFDAALRAPADPAVLNPLYDSGDHLHPSQAGFAAMAAAIDPRELKE